MTDRPDEFSKCPKCEMAWGYHKDGRGPFSHLIGIYDRGRDRTVAWLCPGCGEQWER